MPRLNNPRRAVVLAGMGAACAVAHAQEAPLSDAATQPAKGKVTFRESLRFTRYEFEGRDIDQWVANTRLTLGLSGKLSLSADIPVVLEDDPLDQSEGLGDVRLGLKWRFWQHDTGAIETRRLAMIGGLRVPTGSDGVSAEGFDPFVGVVFTMVHGRHGLNAAARYQFSTDGMDNPLGPGMGGDDALSLETSYLFRVAPEAYGPDTHGSWYAVAESFVDWETNGDTSWRLAPGLLYEARRWAAEVSVVLPLAEDVRERAETDFGLAAGVRVLF